MYKALFFDLDGTLLDTITDIREAINDALKAAGFPFSYSKKECHSLVGNGADVLVHKALQNMDTPDNFAKLKAEYMPRYKAYQSRHTKPFNGLPTVLKYLQNKGIDLLVCSNKPDELAKKIISLNYGDSLFKEVRGQLEGEAPKPDPHIPLEFLAKYGYKKEEVLFVGDSLPDLLTANNAGLSLAICTWGYGFYKPEFLSEAKYIINKPKDLASLGQ